MTLPPEIFKAYDIRGIVGRTLTPDIVRTIGRGLERSRARRSVPRSRSDATAGCRARSFARRSATASAPPAPT
jgi:phosphomannomutase